MKKDREIHSNFDDEDSVVLSTPDGNKQEILYGGARGGDSEGHGHFVVEKIDGLYQVVVDREPDLAGGRHVIESNARRDAYNEEARQNRIIAKELIIKELRKLEPTMPSLGAKVKSLRESMYEVGSCGHADNQRLKNEFETVADQLFQERDRIWKANAGYKEDLIREAESLVYCSDFKSAKEKMKSLQERWKQAPRASKEDEDALCARFSKASDRLYEAAKQDYERRVNEAKRRKEELIRQAESLLYSSDFKVAKEQMNSLQEQWKQAPRASKADEDALWSRFSQAKDRLYETAKQDYERRVNEAKRRKEELIRQAESLANSNDFKTAKEQMKSLQEQWKQAPRASKADEDALWSRFRRASDRLYENAKRDYENKQAQQSQSKVRKEAILSKMENLIYSTDFQSATDEIKSLTEAFYNAGSAGKDNTALFERFKSIKDRFFAAKKQAAEQRRREARNRLQERIDRKRDNLERLESAIRNKEEQLSNLLMRQEPSYNNPRRYEITAQRNARESQINNAIVDMNMRKRELVNEILELQSRMNSMY